MNTHVMIINVVNISPFSGTQVLLLEHDCYANCTFDGESTQHKQYTVW
jgi:hypothetical protein